MFWSLYSGPNKHENFIETQAKRIFLRVHVLRLNNIRALQNTYIHICAMLRNKMKSTCHSIIFQSRIRNLLGLLKIAAAMVNTNNYFVNEFIGQKLFPQMKGVKNLLEFDNTTPDWKLVTYVLLSHDVLSYIFTESAETCTCCVCILSLHDCNTNCNLSIQSLLSTRDTKRIN